MRSRATKGVGGGKGAKGEGWVVLKIPRGDISGVGEDEVTVAWGLHAQAERTNKQTNRGERATSGGGLDQDPKSGDVAHARLATERVLCRNLECTG